MFGLVGICKGQLSIVVKRFLETDSYRACLGETGGVPREQFEGEVLALDAKAHPLLKELPADHQEFLRLAKPLAAYFILQADGLMSGP